jgi:hypothetical protein
MMPNFQPLAPVPTPNTVYARQRELSQPHDVVQQTLDRFDYAGAHQASQLELARVASLPNGGAHIAQGLRDAAVGSAPNALQAWLPPLFDLLQQQGEPPQAAATYAVMGVRAAAVQGAFTRLASMEAHWNAAWEYASLAKIAPVIENSGMFAAVRSARQLGYQPVALPVFNRATGYADASTQTDKPRSTFLHDEAFDALTPTSLDAGAGTFEASSASPLAYVWPEQMAGPEQYLLDPLLPEWMAAPIQAPQFSRPQSPLLLDDVFSFFPVTQPSSPRIALSPSRVGTPDSTQDAPFSLHPSVGRSPSPQPAALAPSEASPNTSSEVSAPVAKRTRSARKRLGDKDVVIGRRATPQAKSRGPIARKDATRLPKLYACAGGCSDPNCDKTFSREAHMLRHRKSVRDIACLFPGCKNMFSRDDNMKQHLRRHGNPVALDLLEA